MAKGKVETKGFSAPTSRKVPPNTKTCCPKCGREVQSLRCGHCGSRLPAEQASLYGAVITKLAKLGGDRTEASKKGGVADDTSDTDYLSFWKRPTPRQRPVSGRAVEDKCIEAEQVAQQLGELKLEDIRALHTFVQAVGGWTRAKWVLEEGQKQWQQNHDRNG